MRPPLYGSPMLHEIFITGNLPQGQLIGTYDLWLVALSFAIATIAAYVALEMCLQLRRETMRRLQVTWQLGGAFAMGAGIWAMHFTGMLAYRTGMEHYYSFRMTIFSLVIPVLVSFFVLEIIRRAPDWKHILTAAPYLGMGIVLMHYSGMAAMQMRANLWLQRDWFILSIVVAIATSGAALAILSRAVTRPETPARLSKYVAALIMGIAICGTHYTGMQAAVIVPLADCRFGSEYDMRNLLMAFGIGGLVILILGVALAAILINQKYLASLKLEVAEHIRESQEKQVLLDTVIENIPLALYAKDVKNDYCWVLWNRAASELFERGAGDILGTTDYEQYAKQDADRLRQADAALMARRQIVTIPSEQIVNPSGNAWVAHTIKVPIYDAKGKPALLLGLIEDITERTRSDEKMRVYSSMLEVQQEALTEAKERADAANVAKSDFLANMSHELRTPLNSILGIMRLLRESPLSPDQREMMHLVFTASSNLLEIVNDILDLSKIEAQEMGIERIGMDLNYLFPTVIDCLRHIAREKKLSVIHQIDPFPYVLADPTRLSQIVTNLLGNAIKYTLQGQVTIRASCEHTNADQVVLYCTVSDTGIGIATEKQSRVFEKFVQGDNSTTRRFGGTGLGLAITKQLVEMMGGTIGMESEVGLGSTFWFRIPFTITDRLESHPMGRQTHISCGTLPAESARILVVEDHPLNQQMIIRVLQRFGVRTITLVDDGIKALALAQTSTWDVILMDCHMPGKNGYEVTEAIRAQEATSGTRQHVPIVAMTANAMRGDREKCLRIGMDEYISKPIDFDALKLILSQWIRFREGTASGHPASTPSATLVPEAVTETLDLSILRSFSEGDLSMEQEMVRIFMQQVSIQIAILGQYRIDGVCNTWVEAAHLIKGGAAGIGANRLSAIADEAQHSTDVTAARRHQLFARLQAEYEVVCKQFFILGLHAAI